MENRRGREWRLFADVLNHIVGAARRFPPNAEMLKCMSPKSAQRFWENDMHRNRCMSPKSAQRFWEDDMHRNRDLKRRSIEGLVAWRSTSRKN
ncbi:MAG: hypothetical protein E5X48_33185 [Mesorhizobium sp.]|nr:MAG: hypothetical protein E5X48_33185 [Mesorhizobium sp.]